jgi:hypothetical protein
MTRFFKKIKFILIDFLVSPVIFILFGFLIMPLLSISSILEVDRWYQIIDKPISAFFPPETEGLSAPLYYLRYHLSQAIIVLFIINIISILFTQKSLSNFLVKTNIPTKFQFIIFETLKFILFFIWFQFSFREYTPT